MKAFHIYFRHFSNYILHVEQSKLYSSNIIIVQLDFIHLQNSNHVFI